MFVLQGFFFCAFLFFLLFALKFLSVTFRFAVGFELDLGTFHSTTAWGQIIYIWLLYTVTVLTPAVIGLMQINMPHVYRVFFKEWSVLLPGSLSSLLKHLSRIWGLTTAVSVPHGWPTQLANCFGDLAAPNELINVPPLLPNLTAHWTCQKAVDVPTDTCAGFIHLTCCELNLEATELKAHIWKWVHRKKQDVQAWKVQVQQVATPLVPLEAWFYVSLWVNDLTSNLIDYSFLMSLWFKSLVLNLPQHSVMFNV